MFSLRKALFATLLVLSEAVARYKKRPSPAPAWYSIWKIRAGPPGSQILDVAERHGILRGYMPPHAEDQRATGINSYVARLISAQALHASK